MGEALTYCFRQLTSKFAIKYIGGFANESATDGLLGESMKVDFAIIKLTVARFVARFFALEVVIDGIFVMATNAMLQPSCVVDFQPPAGSYLCSPTIGLSN